VPLTLDGFAKIALGLPDVYEDTRHGNRTWFVGKKGFAWERPLSKADIKRYGDETPPEGPLAAVLTNGLHEKEALLVAGLPGFFTIPHFDGYPAVLIQLKKAKAADVRDAISEAYFSAK
jgi:hypothetical protein